MSEVFVTSDHHFGHANMLTFVNNDGSRVRPEWDDVDQMDEDLIARWNTKVQPSDHVYHLGDFAIHKKKIQIAERLNGTKTLILGNHDIFDSKHYLKYFRNLRGLRVIDGFVLSHAALHLSSGERFQGNVHGHNHRNFSPVPKGYNVSVEMTNYEPLSWGEFKKIWAKKLEVESWRRAIDKAEEMG